MPLIVFGKSRGRKRRPRWQKAFENWWYTTVRPPGSPNLWFLVVPVLLVGALIFAVLTGGLLSDDLTTMARDLVRNPFRPPKVAPKPEEPQARPVLSGPRPGAPPR